MTQLAQPASLADLIRGRLRDNIASAIPEDQLDALIKAEWDAFFAEKQQGYGGPITSPFKELVKVEIREFMKARIQKDLVDLLEAKWNPETCMAEVLPAVVEKVKPVVLDALVNDMANHVLVGIRNQLQSYR